MRVLIAGFGNRYMGDDGFGPHVIEALEALRRGEEMCRDMRPKLNMQELQKKEAKRQQLEALRSVELRDAGLSGITLAVELGEYDFAIFLDAVMRGGREGTLYTVEISAEDVPRIDDEMFSLSIHETRVEHVLMFAKAIGTLPSNVFFIGCEPSEIKLSDVPSEPVREAICHAVEIVLEKLQNVFSHAGFQP